MDNTTYYQRNKEIMLNRARDYYGNDKERLKDKQEINIETYLKKIKRKRENMKKIDIICLRKETRIERISKTKISRSKRV